jgi:hypothetical protein
MIRWFANLLAAIRHPFRIAADAAPPSPSPSPPQLGGDRFGFQQVKQRSLKDLDDAPVIAHFRGSDIWRGGRR